MSGSARYVWADLVRNPRRSLSTMAGITLGIGLSCSVLFFVDGLSASMTDRAVAPLSIDMQRILNDPIGVDLRLAQSVDHRGASSPGGTAGIRLELRNAGVLPAHEVILRSLPSAGAEYVAGSATIDDRPVIDQGNPFANGPALAGYNLGTIAPGASRNVGYSVTVTAAAQGDAGAARSTVSSREAVEPIPANAPARVGQSTLVADIAAIDGVAFAEPLMFADLAPGSLLIGSRRVDGPVRVFGFAPSYIERDPTIALASGQPQGGRALLSVEAARGLDVRAGDAVQIALPDGSRPSVEVGGTVDLTRARGLYASRRGADFESFQYLPNAIALNPAQFAALVDSAFARAATARGERLKNPPLHEVDIGVVRSRLDADPATALAQTRAVGAAVTVVAGHQDYVLDNISNTLAVAADDAATAKRMFLFLGVPGGLLAGMLAAYAGTVLAGAQRREQAILRIRGASRRQLLTMLAIRVSLITVGGAALGTVLGFGVAAAVLGRQALARASTSSLVLSGVVGAVAGLAATGTALYVTGRRSIEREIDEDRARLATRAPMWRRYRLDVLAVLVVASATIVAVSSSAFEGTRGSVYSGRSVELRLGLLALPIGAWIAGMLLAARGIAALLRAQFRSSAVSFARPTAGLWRASVARRSTAVAEGALIVGLLVALGTTLSVFTTSYNQAKGADARYLVGSDLRITPSPAARHSFSIGDATRFDGPGIAAASPVVYGVHNVVITSHRTSDVANLAAVDPSGYRSVAPLEDSDFPGSSAAAALARLRSDPTAIMLSVRMAAFLQTQVGAPLTVLLARATNVQRLVDVRLVGLFTRLPGFPDGADALMNINRHAAAVPSTVPNLFLARTADGSDATLSRAVAEVRSVPGIGDAVQIDTRATALGRDESSLAALNIRGLLDIDSGFAVAMGGIAIAIFVFGLLLQRRREYVTLRAQGMAPAAIRALIVGEAGAAAVLGCVAGLAVGAAMATYFVAVLRPLFVLTPHVVFASPSIAWLVLTVLAATTVTSLAASALVGRLRATELLRDE